MVVIDYTDPEHFGPIKWRLIHRMAARVHNEAGKIFFVKFMEEIRDTLDCEDCKGHCTKYMQLNPFTPYWNMTDSRGRHIGMFKWTWTFHNSVNHRLGKPIMDWETAYGMHSEGGADQVCTKCGGVDLVGGGSEFSLPMEPSRTTISQSSSVSPSRHRQMTILPQRNIHRKYTAYIQEDD